MGFLDAIETAKRTGRYYPMICPFCDGTGKIRRYKKKSIKCKTCNGTGNISD